MVRKPEGKRPLGIISCRWEDNIKTDPMGKGCEEFHVIHTAQDSVQWLAFVIMVMNLEGCKKAFIIFSTAPLN
jgi:hypothetical protein